MLPREHFWKSRPFVFDCEVTFLMRFFYSTFECLINEAKRISSKPILKQVALVFVI
jgi:hypothetical protein